MVFSGQLLDRLPRKQLVDGCEAFQDLRDCVSNGFDFEPDSVGCLGIESIATNPSLNTSETGSLVSQLGSRQRALVGGRDLAVERSLDYRLARTRAKAS